MQEWIFQALGKYKSDGPKSEFELKVYASNRTYSQNAKLKLTNSDDWPQKAYIVDSSSKNLEQARQVLLLYSTPHLTVGYHTIY